MFLLSQFCWISWLSLGLFLFVSVMKVSSTMVGMVHALAKSVWMLIRGMDYYVLVQKTKGPVLVS